MTDPVTPNLSFTLPQVGGDNGVWGGYLNTDITNIDTAFGGNQSLTVTSADVTITNSQFSNAIFTVTGGLTGNRNLFVPISPNSTTAAGIACGGRFVVVNNTSNAYNLTVKTTLANSSGVVVPQGGEAFLYSDGLNVLYSNRNVPGAAIGVNGNPTGQIGGIAGSANTNVDLAYDYTNNNIYACTVTGSSSSATWAQPVFAINRGFDTPVNLSLAAAVNSNILTVTFNAASNSSSPSPTNPVIFNFPDSTVANGDPVALTLVSSLTLSTVVGGTLGSVNGSPFRLWIAMFNNSGTAVPALIRCFSSATSQVFPLNEAALGSATAMSSLATSAGTFYCSSGASVTNKSFRIVGYLTYETALATAGTYNNAPDVVRLFGPGIKKPGDPIQGNTAIISSGPAIVGTGSYISTGTTVSLTPTSNANIVKLYASQSYLAGGSGSEVVLHRFSRSSAPTLLNPITAVYNIALHNVTGFLAGYDNPGVSSAVNYYVYFNGSANDETVGSSTLNSYIEATEIMV